MKIVLTVNMGFTIPEAWASLDYAGMVAAIQTETTRQLQPFITANAAPDIILLENEGTDGYLYIDNSTSHIRGADDKKQGSQTQLNDEICGRRPGGNMATYPQLAGFYKAQVQACTSAYLAAGLDPGLVRFGLHDHGQYHQWKQGIVWGDGPGPLDKERNQKDADGNACDLQAVIPADLYNTNVAEVLDIMGFSSYSDRPANIDDLSTYNVTFDRIRTSLQQGLDNAQKFGRWESGPFKGQLKKQSLGVEYAVEFVQENENDIKAEKPYIDMLWEVTKGFENMLGELWYEIWYRQADLVSFLLPLPSAQNLPLVYSTPLRNGSISVTLY